MLAGVAVVDASGRQTYVNRAFAAMVGWDEAELVGTTPPFPYWAPEDRENIETALGSVISGRIDPSGYELRFRRRDGERFDAFVLVAPFAQPDGAPGFLASVSDITERKSAQRTATFLAEAGEILNRSLEYEETCAPSARWSFRALRTGASSTSWKATAASAASPSRIRRVPPARRSRAGSSARTSRRACRTAYRARSQRERRF
ncbi:MAG: PAS domain S-box protein [Thermoanaerobaculia bacterium]